ncbi:ribosome biogenesis protein SPATA5L1-like isoform X1 [Mya arenaria]|nr:ribosome biogenesis protein SPATA5L1-like isoform X1 [Mya arenaria]
MELRIFHSASDSFHQKCFTNKETLSALSVQVGDYVEIETEGRRFISSIWVKNGLTLNSLFMNDCVSCRVENKTVSCNEISTLSPMIASDVKVTVILPNIEDVIKMQHNAVRMNETTNHCKDILTRLCVLEDFTVNCSKSKFANLAGIGRIKIDEVTCNAIVPQTHLSSYIITTGTNLTINKVHSEEWYSKMTKTEQLVKPGGLDSVLGLLRDLVRLPLDHKHQFSEMGVKPPRGILLRGPPGCGKTSLVRYLAQTEKIFLLSINGPDIFGPLPGETEENMRKIFLKAKTMSREGPCMLFIDEIDSICPRGGKSESTHAVRATAQFLSLMDGLSGGEDFLVVAATNRPSSLHPGLRRPGRLDREVLVSPPNVHQRLEILESHAGALLLGDDLDLVAIATVTNGYVGADLASLCYEASYLAMAEHSKVSQAHFLSSLHKVRPSLQKGAEGVVDVRPVSWDDIGGLDSVKLQIKQAVEWPLKHPEAFQRMGLSPPCGVLLYGPPGCCKTTLVRAAATACHSTFLTLSGAQLYSPFVGESERLISEVFQKARACAPSILFLDEIDSIVGKRSASGSRGVQERVLSTLLNEMDGVGVRLDEGTGGSQRVLEGSAAPTCIQVSEHTKVKKVREKTSVENKSVLVVAATNRPDLLDEALMRPGRIDRIVYVGHPDQQARHQILSIYTQGLKLHECSLDELVGQTDMYTGADLQSLCREAALCALTEDLSTSVVAGAHFQQALGTVPPSLTPDLISRYAALTIPGRPR